MKIDKHTPKPATEYRLTFSHDEGLALVMALKDAHENYRAAVDRDEWLWWANTLSEQLRS